MADQAAVLDSLTLCKFLRHCFDDLPAEAASLYEMVTGWPTDGPALQRAGARVNTLKRLFNLRQGATRADDTLPPRLLETIDLGPLLDAYYQERGWRTDGTIPSETLATIGLDAIL